MLVSISITLALLLHTSITCAASLSIGYGDQCESVLDGYTCDTSASRNWGPYTPWFDVKSTISPMVPEQCEITFAQLLSRHGARYPTKGASTLLSMVVSRLKRTAKTFPGKYAFLKDYKFKCITGALTVYGQRELYDSGVDFYRRYEPLTKNNDPFCRASGMKRVIMSGQNFTYGYLKARSKANSPRIPVMVLPSKLHQNCTLNPSTCTAFELGPKRGMVEAMAFAKVFTPPITKRFNSDLGTSLSNRDMLALMSMCPFDTVAHQMASPSPFCNLFTATEFDAYNTFQSFLKYYDFGAGSTLGPSIGVGWTNELIARMTNTPVKDQTSTNRTLDSNPATFPLGRKLYADFSHDTVMTAIMFAMGLYPTAKPGRGPGVYNAATAVPFAARVYIEKMRCPRAKEELVRILINGRVVPLPNCGADAQGRCTLSRFVASQSFARKGGNWNKCYDGIYGTLHHIGLEAQGGDEEKEDGEWDSKNRKRGEWTTEDGEEDDGERDYDDLDQFLEVDW